jgi:hypothetical protein
MVRVSDDRLPVHVCPNYSSRTGQNVAQIFSADPNLTYDVDSMFRQWTDEVGAFERTAFRRDHRLSFASRARRQLHCKWSGCEGPKRKRQDDRTLYAGEPSSSLPTAREFAHKEHIFFIKVVWIDSDALGCAVQKCSGMYNLVCNYGPPGKSGLITPGIRSTANRRHVGVSPGNYGGQFVDKVDYCNGKH